MNIYKVRARLKLDQVRADIADLPDDDTTTFALRGIADLLNADDLARAKVYGAKP